MTWHATCNVVRVVRHATDADARMVCRGTTTCSRCVQRMRRWRGLVCSDDFCHLTQYPRTEVLGRNCKFLQASQRASPASQPASRGPARDASTRAGCCDWRPPAQSAAWVGDGSAARCLRCAGARDGQGDDSEHRPHAACPSPSPSAMRRRATSTAQHASPVLCVCLAAPAHHLRRRWSSVRLGIAECA